MGKRPIQCNTDQTDFNETEYKEFIEIVSDSTLQVTFNKRPFIEFWSSVKEEYLQLSEKAMKPLPFPTTYTCVSLDFLYVKQHIAIH